MKRQASQAKSVITSAAFPSACESYTIALWWVFEFWAEEMFLSNRYRSHFHLQTKPWWEIDSQLTWWE
jgi:hypothetical protein